MVWSYRAGGFVLLVDSTTSSGTPSVARRWLQLEAGELIWRFGHEQLLDEAAAVSKAIAQPPEPTRVPSTLSVKTSNKLQLVVDTADDPPIPGWVAEAREKLQTEKDDFALSPLGSPLSSHKSFARLSPLVSPVVQSPGHVTVTSKNTPKHQHRRRTDVASWDSPLRGPGSNRDVLSVAGLALGVVTRESGLTCCTENDEADYMEDRDKRERLRKSAREADRPLPTFEPLVLKTTYYSNVLRVVLGAPDSAGNSAYNFVVSEDSDLEKWQTKLKAGVEYAASHNYWEERLRQLEARTREVNRHVGVWQRALAKAEKELEIVDDKFEQVQEACARADELAEWSVADTLARTERNQTLLKAEKLSDVLNNAYWPGLEHGPQRVASMLLANGMSTA